MKFQKKQKPSSEIPTAAMPDIIFMLLIFFMVTTVIKTVSGLPVSLPSAEKIEKIESNRHLSYIFVNRTGLVNVDDHIVSTNDLVNIMYQKRVEDLQLTVSLKGDKLAKMGTIDEIHQSLRKADCLRLMYASLFKSN